MVLKYKNPTKSEYLTCKLWERNFPKIRIILRCGASWRCCLPEAAFQRIRLLVDLTVRLPWKQSFQLYRLQNLDEEIHWKNDMFKGENYNFMKKLVITVISRSRFMMWRFTKTAWLTTVSQVELLQHSSKMLGISEITCQCSGIRLRLWLRSNSIVEYWFVVRFYVAKVTEIVVYKPFAWRVEPL